jgi:hypothetical protein
MKNDQALLDMPNDDEDWFPLASLAEKKIPTNALGCEPICRPGIQLQNGGKILISDALSLVKLFILNKLPAWIPTMNKVIQSSFCRRSIS